MEALRFHLGGIMRGTLFAALAAVLSLMGAQGQATIVVNESKIQAVLENESTTIVVPIESSLDHAVRASLTLDWISKDDGALGSSQRDLSIPPGRTTVEVPLRIPEPTLWLRLRYSIVPERGDARAFAPQSKIVALPQIAEHVFELKVTQVGVPRRGKPFTVHAQAIHPVTRVPIQGLTWNTRLTVDGVGLAPARISPQTEGFVDFVFDIPPADESEQDDEAQVWVQGRRGDFVADILADIPLPAKLSARLQTDKPIYQPGQTMHLRAVVLDPQDQALEGAKIALRIEDEVNGRIHTAHLVSSRFGIIQDDYALPATADLGAYQIALATEEDDNYTIAQHVVRVSNYELPTFNVAAKPDRVAYLPDQQAKVSVTGTYIFGKPVPKGTVKVTRSQDRHWNTKTRRYESTSEDVAEGQAGEDGTFIAELDLQSDHDGLQESNERFHDVHFVAYYTDPTSGRTEQRRFDVRITREPIHVYVIGSNSGGRFSAPVYVSTDYADGRPASTDVELHCQGRTTRLHTNQYGVGRALLARDQDGYGELEARATDTQGQVGTWTEHYWRPGLEYLRLDTGRTMFRTGESVAVQISAPPGDPLDEFVRLDAIAGDQSVASRIVRLVKGRAQVTFPYQTEFRRTVIFAAWNAASAHSVYGYDILASKAVIFSDASELRVTASTDRTVYKPGEKASLRIQVSSADGRPVEAALGLAVVDQAVLERARTDSEFGHRPWFDCAFCGNDGEREIGGVRLNDLYALKPAVEISSDLDLVAEALVAGSGAFISSKSSESLTDRPRFTSVATQLEKINSSLDRHYAETLEFPKDAGALARILGRQWLDLRDPWGMPYTPTFSIERDDNVLLLTSSGPDKHPDTPDDFIAGTFRKSYFRPIQTLIQQIFNKHEDYPASDADFRSLLSANGLLLNALRDPWGTPYRARVDTRGVARHIAISSAGPDRKFETPDDFVAATFSGSYFERERAEITQALQSMAPQTLEEFQHILKSAGIDISQYRDAWGRPYHLTSTISSRYSDRINSTTVRVFGGPPASRTAVIPVTQRLISFSLRSSGPDGTEDTYDDFDIARFVTVLKEESAEESSVAQPQPATLLHGTGAITGLITDPSGAVITNGTLILLDAAGKSYETPVEQDGIYRFTSVPPGSYSLRASSPGFRLYEISHIPVTADKTTTVDITLDVGSVSETVSVEASALPLNTAMSVLAPGSTGTPRVREYFPETLLWLPEVLTDKSGTARTQVALADSVTTWKVAVLASTLDGRIAEADSEFRSFQPFFLDFNPPSVLTEGDQVDLSVTVRNYQDREQKVGVNIPPSDWATVQGPSAKAVVVPANSSANVTYTIHANGVNEKARQRIVASAGRDRDAIEKSIRVHPDGQEVTHTAGDLMSGSASFSISIPSTVISGATRGELRVYPNIASMLFESAGAILESPHGCAEQTISAGYANLVALRYARAVGISDARFDKLALSNIRQARDSLVAFEASDGGIRYWATGEPDTGVTAYALSFLVDASAIIAVDTDALSPLVTWLQKRQGTDGRWVPRIVNSELADRQSVLLTGLVVRALAAAQKAGVEVQAKVLGAAYHHIARFTDLTSEPYLLAEFILAALDSGDEVLLGNAATRLAALAQEEKDGLYWDLRTNSPFYGWGAAGRFETTGLVISALSAWRSRHLQSTELDPVIRRGLVFLLRGRDRLGSWFSTQATVRAMSAMADASPVLGKFGGNGSGGRTEIRVNGHAVKTVVPPGDPRATDPVLVDLSSSLSTGENRVELIQSGGAQSALVRLSSGYWLPWKETQARNSSELRLAVHFDPAEARIGEPIRCSIKAERIGFRGYGMMLAEIGLPPGADVDRGSLESLLDDTSLGLDRYEVLPDRVVLYLWPKAGGASFNFVLRARMPMTAKSAPSTLYDYYNPEALSEVAPVRWVVK